MSGGVSHSSSRQKDVTPEEYKAKRPFVAKWFTDYQGGAPYTGEMFSPITENEQSIISGLMGQRTPFGQDASREELLATIQGQSPIFTKALEEAIAAGQIDISRFAEQENLGNRALFNRAGQTLSESSPFAMAQAKSGQAILDAAAKLSADIRLPAMLQERQNQLAAIEMLGTQEQQALDRELKILEAEGLPRLIQEEGIARGLELYKAQQDRILQAKTVLAQLTQPTLATRSRSSSSQGGVL